MATTTINSALEGSSMKFYSAGLVFWTGDVRDATTGTFATTYTTSTTLANGFLAEVNASRSGYTGTCYRTFLFFNNFGTGVAGNITSAQIKIYNGSSASTVDSILIESTAWNAGGDTTLDNADYSAIDHSRAYSSLATSWSAGYNTITLNANAIQDMNSNGYFNMALIEGTYDYGDTTPSVGFALRGGVKFKDSFNRNKLILTYSTGFSDDINGVSSGDIVSVNGVATANIASFNGVS